MLVGLFLGAGGKAEGQAGGLGGEGLSPAWAAAPQYRGSPQSSQEKGPVPADPRASPLGFSRSLLPFHRSLKDAKQGSAPEAPWGHILGCFCAALSHSLPGQEDWSFPKSREASAAPGRDGIFIGKSERGSERPSPSTGEGEGDDSQPGRGCHGRRAKPPQHPAASSCRHPGARESPAHCSPILSPLAFVPLFKGCRLVPKPQSGVETLSS